MVNIMKTGNCQYYQMTVQYEKKKKKKKEGKRKVQEVPQSQTTESIKSDKLSFGIDPSLPCLRA